MGGDHPIALLDGGDGRAGGDDGEDGFVAGNGDWVGRPEVSGEGR